MSELELNFGQDRLVDLFPFPNNRLPFFYLKKNRPGLLDGFPAPLIGLDFIKRQVRDHQFLGQGNAYRPHSPPGAGQQVSGLFFQTVPGLVKVREPLHIFDLQFPAGGQFPNHNPPLVFTHQGKLIADYSHGHDRLDHLGQTFFQGNRKTVLGQGVHFRRGQLDPPGLFQFSPDLISRYGGPAGAFSGAFSEQLKALMDALRQSGHRLLVEIVDRRSGISGFLFF